VVAVRAGTDVAAERRSADPVDRRPAIVATVLAAALAVGYLVSPLTGQDTSAQLARADFAKAHPLVPVDLSWFGGTVQFGYSLWAPWLGGVVGIRLLGAIAAVLGTWLATRLLQRARPARPMGCGVAVAICQVADLAVGRITYQCGLVCALAAVLAVLNGRRVAAVPLAFLAGAASPVVTIGLGIVAATAALRRRFGDAALLAVAGGLGTAIVAVVFGDGGTMTFVPESVIRAVLATVLVIALVPRRHEVIRIGAALNLAVIVVAWTVSSPVGSNAERLSLLFAIPIIAAFVEWRAWLAAGAVVVAVLAQPPAMPDIARLAGVPASHGSYYQPLLAAVDRQGPLTGRVEVPEINGHWDAALLAQHVPLARGWLRQVDTELNNDVFFGDGPDAATYRSWLERNAVQYVAVPDARLTKGGQREKALVEGGLPYLRAVWSDQHWTLYAVQPAAPIVDAPARMVSSDAARIVVEVPGGATALIRIRWFRWTTLGPASSGCIADDHGQVRLHTDPGRGLVRYVISSSADPFKSAAARGHCP